jgi:outer membrane autotransporter protein
LLNTGRITLTNEWAAGLGVEGNGNRLTNRGSISMERDKADGLRAYGHNNVLTNNASINVSGANSAGMRVTGTGNALLNTGTIKVTGRESAGVQSALTDSSSDNTFVNRGTIQASGEKAVGIDVHRAGRITIINEAAGVITSQQSHAIKLNDHPLGTGDDHVENYGRISNLSGGEAVDLGTGNDKFLIGSTSRIDGAIEAGDGRDTFTLSGTVDGKFDLSRSEPRNFEVHEKIGTSTWTVSGTSNRIMPWHVREGELMVTGTMGGSAMNVYDGATLGGTGTVGSIDARSGSTLSPGMNGIGSLAVTGNVLIADGTVYKIDLNTAQQSDQIVAAGKADVQGGTVQVNALPGDYRPGSRWTILTATGGVGGQFSQVTTSLAFFRPILSKDGQHIYLSLPRIDEPQPSNPFNPSEEPSPHPGSSPTPFDVGTVLVHDDLFRAAVLCRLRCSSGGLPSFAASDIVTADYAADMPVSKGSAAPLAVAVPRMPRDWTLWAKAIGSWGSTKATPASEAVHRSTGGLVVGADMGLGSPYRLGIAAGYFSTNLDFASAASGGNVESLHLGVYGSASFGALNLRGGLAYAHHEVDTSFTASYASNRFSSSLDSFQAFGELGYAIPLNDRVVIEPFVGLAHVHVANSGVQVDGSDIAVTGQVHSFDTTYSTLGARLIATMPTNVGTITFKGLLGWRHAFGDIVPKATFSIAGDSRPLLIRGAPIDKDSLVVEAGLNWEVKKNVTLGVSYTGAMGRRDQEHTIRGSLNIRF